MKRFASIFGIAVVVFASAVWSSRETPWSFDEAATAGERAREHSVTSGASPRDIDVLLRTTGRLQGRAESPARLPKSLRGTDVDGALAVDETGRFVPNRDAVALFEYYLTAVGEESYRDVVARIEAEINDRLAPSVAADAIAFLRSYLAYREDAGRYLDSGEAGGLRTGLERLKALRRARFGDELAAELFGDEEARTEAVLARQAVAEDPSLDPETRNAQLREIEASLPEAVRESRRRSTAHLELASAEAALVAEGADDEAIRAAREARFGAEAADRLAELDRERARWRERVDGYRLERDAIAADTTLTPEQKSARIAHMESERFSDNELLRVRALDRLAAGN
jgi:lipase chaperone LimK